MDTRAEVPSYISTNLLKPRPTCLEDKNLLYVQPTSRNPIVCLRSYKRPTIKTETATTYINSYTNYGHRAPHRPTAKRCKSLSEISGKIDCQTVHKLSYKKVDGKPALPLFPKGRLAFRGSHDMKTVYGTSYSNYNFAKTVPYKPPKGKLCNPVPMDCKTVMTESYSHPGKIKKTSPLAPQKCWQTKFKNDYRSVSHLSFQHVNVIPRRVNKKITRPPISAKMEGDSVYSMSYKLPGHCVSK